MRKHELHALRDALDRVEVNGSVEQVWIEAESGNGKSALLRHFHQNHLAPLLETNTNNHHQKLELLVCSETFEETRTTPDGSCCLLLEWEIQFMNELLVQLISDYPDPTTDYDGKSFLTTKNKHNLEPSQVEAIVSVARTTHGLVHSSAELGGERSTQANNDSATIQSAICGLLRLICQQKIVVLVLDDMQWASSSQIQLLQSILGDPCARNLLVVGAYQPFSSAPSTTLRLNNLDANEVSEVVCSLIWREQQDCAELVGLLCRRTEGHVSCLLEFVHTLEKEHLLHFCMEKSRWEWDYQHIVANTSIADHLAETILAEGHRRLSTQLKGVLHLAARIGSPQFSAALVHQLIHSYDMQRVLGWLHASGDWGSSSVENMEQFLGVAVDQGFLECVGRDYKFSHDQIRDAAAQQWFVREQTQGNASDSTDSNLFHLGMGRSLSNIPQAMRDESLVLVAVDHLNQGESEMASSSERVALAQENLHAAKICLKSVNAIAATSYLQQGLKLLRQENSWTPSDDGLHYKTTLSVSNTLTGVLLSTGKLKESMTLIQETLDHARTFEDQLRPYRFQLRCLSHSGDAKSAMTLSIRILDQLGIVFPQSTLAKTAMLLRYVTQLKKYARRRKARKQNKTSALDNLWCDDFLRKPVKDSNILFAMEFCQGLVEAGIFVGDMLIQACGFVVMFQITLQHGYTPQALVALAGCAVMYSKLGDYDSAHFFDAKTHKWIDQLAASNDLQLEGNESIRDSITTVLPMLAVAVNHWKHPLVDSLNLAIKSKKIAMESGALHNIYVCLFSYTTLYIQCGLSLYPLYHDICRRELSSSFHLSSRFESALQFVLNLMGHAQDPLILTGEIMNEESSVALYKQNNDTISLQMFYLYKMFLAVFFDQMATGNDWARLLLPVRKLPPRAFIPMRLFCEGLIGFSLAGKRGHSAHASRGRKFLKKLQQLVDKGCANVYHFVLLLRAVEEAHCFRRGNPGPVQALFDKAIAAAGRRGYTHIQALGNELAGKFFLQLCDNEEEDDNDDDQHYWSRTYLTRAWALYTAWGATAKAMHLQNCHKSLLGDLDKSRLRGSLLKATSIFEDVPSSLCGFFAGDDSTATSTSQRVAT